MIATDRTARKFVGYLFGLVVRTTACHTKERECLTRFDALHRVPLWSRPSFEVPRSMCEFPLRRLERVGSDRLWCALHPTDVHTPALSDEESLSDVRFTEWFNDDAEEEFSRMFSRTACDCNATWIIVPMKCLANPFQNHPLDWSTSQEDSTTQRCSQDHRWSLLKSECERLLEDTPKSNAKLNYEMLLLRTTVEKKMMKFCMQRLASQLLRPVRWSEFIANELRSTSPHKRIVLPHSSLQTWREMTNRYNELWRRIQCQVQIVCRLIRETPLLACRMVDSCRFQLVHPFLYTQIRLSSQSELKPLKILVRSALW